MSDLINLSIRSFRAIKEAEIKLNGITVVAGENGCGKSSISKFLYYSIKSSIEYDRLIEQELSKELYPFIDAIHLLWSEISRSIKSPEIEEFFYYQYRDVVKFNQKDKLFSLLLKLMDFYQKNPQERIEERRYMRINAIINDLLYENKKERKISDILNSINEKIEAIFTKYQEKLVSRPSDILLKELSRVFRRSEIPIEFEIREYDTPLLGKNEDYILKAQTINRTAYIDTPMLLGTSYSRRDSHWDDVEDILRTKYEKEEKTDISEDIKSNILNGESRIDEDELFVDSIKFYRKDKSVFDLLDCATGVKSLSIIQMMLDNGFLNSKTLLIMDEPEVHLHPQWIVEYARIIVRLNKELGVKFFIASHSPDMVSAIKYIGEKEGLKEKLNFYLAEKVDHEEVYKYLPLGTDIEPIFKSFNIALDRISLYGSTEEEEDYEEKL